MQGFFLGLANGGVCLAYCAPVLIPYVLGEAGTIKHNYALLARFLVGRLLAYLLVGLLAWALGGLLLSNASYQAVVIGLAYIVLALLMAFYSFYRPPETCAGKLIRKQPTTFMYRWPGLVPVFLGLATGLNLCPPLLLAFTGAAAAGSLLKSLVLFLAFFAGTSLYFVPIPVLGALSRFEALRIVGRLACLIMALYYLYSGIITLGGGLITI